MNILTRNNGEEEVLFSDRKLILLTALFASVVINLFFILAFEFNGSPALIDPRVHKEKNIIFIDQDVDKEFSEKSNSYIDHKIRENYTPSNKIESENSKYYEKRIDNKENKFENNNKSNTVSRPSTKHSIVESNSSVPSRAFGLNERKYLKFGGTDFTSAERPLFLSDKRRKINTIKKNVSRSIEKGREYILHRNDPSKPDSKMSDIFKKYLGTPMSTGEQVQSKLLYDGSRVEKIRTFNGHYCVRIPSKQSIVNEPGSNRAALPIPVPCK